jgi:hypothetical protein
VERVKGGDARGGAWTSWLQRVRDAIALREKRVSRGFEFVEEDPRVRQRSDLVRRMHEPRVPPRLQLHEHIDEVVGGGGTGGGLLVPADPLQRARVPGSGPTSSTTR